MVRRHERSRLYLMLHFEVPVVVVFTKHDQFLLNVEMHMSDYPNRYPDSNVSEVAEKIFQEHYMRPLSNGITFVCLKSGYRVKCLESMLMSISRNAHAKYSLR